jgi:hypothetical protein
LDEILAKSGGRRVRAFSGKSGNPGTDEPPGDGGPDEAALFIAETVTDLAAIARRHELPMLVRLLEMARLEAEERVSGEGRRGRRNLS